MGWASGHIDKLSNGETVKFRPRGNSMNPKIKSGNLVTVEPISCPPDVGSIVLCKVRGRQYLHIVSAIKKDRFQISNNKGRVNGWIGLSSIYGICTKVES